MTAPLGLALAIHNHQPVGNFGWVYADAFRLAYQPFLAALERHPPIRLALHYTGPLLEWLRAEQPVFLERLIALVGRGQVELMGGGYHEPILAALPERDRVGQLERMADELERLGAPRPRGAWLAERVWEPSLPRALADAGYGWTIVDDAHFRAASVPPDEAWGPYSTDDEGRRIDVFASDQRLRYTIPFGAPEEVLEYLRSIASDEEPRLATMGDDGEKFGSWPRTFEHCWGADGWVERFLDALEEASDWLTTVTPSDWLAEHAPVGRAYLPTASYVEMSEWVLPPEESVAFGAALRSATEDGRPEARWLRGGFWRNYQARYREVNDLHKAMLRVSAKVAAMPPGGASGPALDHLYRCQSNDTYWHGIFGGVYINHLRLAAWEHLIAAEDLADPIPAPRAELADADLDGREEAILWSAAQLAVVHLDEGGALGEWDIRAARHAMTAVMRRRPEASHLRLREAQRRRKEGDAERSAHDAGGAGEAASIHERKAGAEEGLVERIVYDRYERRSGIVHLLEPATSRAAFEAVRFRELGDFVDRPFTVVSLTPASLALRRDGTLLVGDGPRSVRVDKSFTFGGERLEPAVELEVRVENRAADPVAALLGVEWTLNLLGGGGNPQAWYLVRGKRSRHDGSGSIEGVAALSFGNDGIGLAIEASAVPPAGAWWHPIETVSSSEAGFERSYQGSALLFHWPIELTAGESFVATMRLAARCARDRSAEEAAALPGAAAPTA